MSIINGSDLLIVVGDKAIGGCTSHTINFSTETKDRSVKPALSVTSLTAGLWKGKGVTGLSYSVSCEGLVFIDEAEYGFKDLLAAYKAGQPVTIKATYRSNEDPYLSGSVVITKLTQSAPANDDTTYSVEFENNGEPTIFDATKFPNTPAS